MFCNLDSISRYFYVYSFSHWLIWVFCCCFLKKFEIIWKTNLLVPIWITCRKKSTCPIFESRFMDDQAIVHYQGFDVPFPVGTPLSLIRAAFNFSGGFLKNFGKYHFHQIISNSEKRSESTHGCSSKPNSPSRKIWINYCWAWTCSPSKWLYRILPRNQIWIRRTRIES